MNIRNWNIKELYTYGNKLFYFKRNLQRWIFSGALEMTWATSTLQTPVSSWGQKQHVMDRQDSPVHFCPSFWILTTVKNRWERMRFLFSDCVQTTSENNPKHLQNTTWTDNSTWSEKYLYFNVKLPSGLFHNFIKIY